MAPKTTNLAILFADIAGSTKLYETLGDDLAKAKISATLDTLAGVVKENNGVVIKTIGDEVMCTFPTAEEAASAATGMHEILAEDITEGLSDSVVISIRVGFHFGPAIHEKGDVFGDAVNVAARMAAQAKGDQIITSESTIALLPPILKASTRFIDHAPIKGKKEVIDIYELIWQEEDVTRMATGMMAEKPVPEAKLRLVYNNQDFQLSKQKPTCVIKFFIVDQSTNGTHVRIENGEDAFLRREEMPLTGNGQISLGKSFNEGPSEVVKFIHET